jgi:RHS repeat-associated protein
VSVGGYSAQQQFIQMYSYNQAGHVTPKRLELYQPNGAAGYPGSYTTQSWDVGYTYNTYGQAVSTTYPGVNAGTVPGAPGNPYGQTYTVGFDSMNRPNTLTDSRGFYAVQGTQYNAANQLTQVEYQYAAGYFGSGGASFWENRGYNAMNQLTAVNNFNDNGNPATPDGPLQMRYNYTAGSNNGQIASATAGSGSSASTVSHTYDALKRLTAASSSGAPSWSQSYSYDGFGNMTSKQGDGMPFVNAMDQTTNRLAGTNICYDLAGNLISDQNGGGCGNPNYGYDAANRLVSVSVSGGTERYYYTADNKRVSTISSSGAQTVFIYGAFGEKLSWVTSTGSILNGGLMYNNVYFAGRLIKQGTDAVSGTSPTSPYPDDYFVGIDRLGSVTTLAHGTATTILPYGEEYDGTANGGIKFATYTRDASTGLDYADQRFYSSQFGRFLSADRYVSGAVPGIPAAWNRYTYVIGDPVNLFDPTGRDFCDPGDPDYPECDAPCTQLAGASPADSCGDPGGGGGGGPAPQPPTLTLDAETGGSGNGSKVLNWLPKAVHRLTKFKTKANSNCDKDLSAINLTPASVEKLAATVPIEDASSANPAVYKILMDKHADFGVLTGQSYDGIVYYNSSLFWQNSFSLLLGTLVHEFSHLAGSDDIRDQTQLGLAVGAATSNISIKLATDCFGYKPSE